MPEAYELLARAALLEITPADTVGDYAGQVDEGDGAVSVEFYSAMPGYPDWRWTVSIAEVDGEDPTVLEVELMPGPGALLAPDWVPWSERLADYKAAQEGSDEPDSEDESDEDDADSDDDESDDDDSEDDPDEDDESDDDDSDDEDDELDEDDVLGNDVLHGGDLDGVDIDALDAVDVGGDDEDDDESDDDESDDDDDESDDDEHEKSY